MRWIAILIATGLPGAAFSAEPQIKPQTRAAKDRTTSPVELRSRRDPLLVRRAEQFLRQLAARRREHHPTRFREPETDRSIGPQTAPTGMLQVTIRDLNRVSESGNPEYEIKTLVTIDVLAELKGQFTIRAIQKFYPSLGGSSYHHLEIGAARRELTRRHENHRDTEALCVLFAESRTSGEFFLMDATEFKLEKRQLRE